MILDATRLLSEREFAHPSKMVSLLMADRALVVTIAGTPWWRDRPRNGEAQIVFRFSGLTDGNLDLPSLLEDENDEIPEPFEITLTSKLDWAQCPRFKIFCSSPLPDPVAVYTAVEDYLLNSHAPRTPADFLNGAERLSQFLQITASSGFLLAEGPECIRRIVVGELQAQSARYTVIDWRGYPEAQLFVRLGETAFFCDAAVAEFD